MSGTTETPGMDEIRASISRIIADDEQGRGLPVASDTADGEASFERAVYTLRPAAPASAAPDRMPPFQADAVREPPNEPVDEPRSGPSPEEISAGQAAFAEIPERLLSTVAEAAAGAAFAEIERSLGRPPRSLEDVVAEMLRPMLKAWLDENLPAMVERLVQAEIERVSRTRR
jgi:cell pole-organizing protein PopZ